MGILQDELFYLSFSNHILIFGTKLLFSFEIPLNFNFKVGIKHSSILCVSSLQVCKFCKFRPRGHCTEHSAAWCGMIFSQLGKKYSPVRKKLLPNWGISYAPAFRVLALTCVLYGLNSHHRLPHRPASIVGKVVGGLYKKGSEFKMSCGRCCYRFAYTPPPFYLP